MLYKVEMRRTSFVTVTVEAPNREEAEQLAWDEVLSDGSYGTAKEAEWETGFIDEVFATDETRSNGNP